MKRCPIAVIAHNEERYIGNTINSILKSFEKQDKYVPEIYVIANGCTDATTSIISQIAKKDPAVKLFQLSLADKNNAWNYYVYEVAPDLPFHIILDGDIITNTSAFVELIRTFKNNPDVYAVAALPRGGRNANKYASQITNEQGL